MRSVLFIAPLLALVACGPSKDDFTDESIRITCDKMFECGGEAAASMLGYSDADDCVTQLTTAADEAEASDTGEESCANYDSSKASDCLDALETLACDASEADVTAMNDTCTAVCGE